MIYKGLRIGMNGFQKAELNGSHVFQNLRKKIYFQPRILYTSHASFFEKQLENPVHQCESESRKSNVGHPGGDQYGREAKAD